MRWPIASKTGSSGCSASSGPEARITSLPSSAGFLVPRTGASTKVRPRRAACSAQRSVASIPIVPAWTQVAPGAAAASAPSSPPATARVASASLRTVITVAAPLRASAGLAQAVAPSSSPSSASFSAERFQARTSIPAASRLREIPFPIVPPAPRTATGEDAAALNWSNWSDRGSPFVSK